MAAHVNTTTTTNLGSGSGSSSHNNPNQWSVDDVAEWLGIIGLGHKAETLKTQGVTGAQLSRMSEGDLKNLGLTALQVRKIQNALPQPPASGAASTTTMRSSAGDTTTTTVELKRELESLKAQVAMLTASMNSLQASSSSSSTTAAVMATPVLAQPVATPSSNANAPSHKVRVPGFCRDCFIEGNQSQILTVVMGPGDVVQADKGAMVHMSSYIQMDTTTGGQGFGRLLTGSTLFLTEYQYTGPPNTADEIAFSPDFAGQIIPIDLRQYGGHVICQQSSILASSPTVKVSIEFSQSLGAGFFGGEGCESLCTCAYCRQSWAALRCFPCTLFWS